MAGVLKAKCVACGNQHNFFLPGADIFNPAYRYEYTCPKTITPARLTIGEGWTQANVDARPKDAVVVTQFRN